MNNQVFDISVIVLSYHPDYTKLFQTLHSVIHQKNVDLEVIVSDDGTPDFQKEKVEEWFEKQGFCHYTVLAHKENKGTVKNVLSAVTCATAGKVKLISPGDYLYDDGVLRKVCDFMDENQSKTCFGKAAYYSETESGYTIHQHVNPRYIRPYLKKNQKSIQNNYLIYKDYVLGAVFASHRETLLNYLRKIDGKVVYAEDCAVICMVADGISIDYWNDYMIWYEYGTGISTNQSTSWNQRLYQDNERCFAMIKEEHAQWEKAYKVMFDPACNRRFLKRVRFFLHHKMTQLYHWTHREKQTLDVKQLEKLLDVKSGNKED